MSNEQIDTLAAITDEAEYVKAREALIIQNMLDAFDNVES